MVDGRWWAWVKKVSLVDEGKLTPSSRAIYEISSLSGSSKPMASSADFATLGLTLTGRESWLRVTRRLRRVWCASSGTQTGVVWVRGRRSGDGGRARCLT